MANDLTCNPLRIDTAGTSAIITNLIMVTKVVWAGGAIAAADTMVLNNQRGKKIIEMGAVGADEHRQQDFVPPLPMDGIIPLTIAHGEVLVYWTGNQPRA